MDQVLSTECPDFLYIRQNLFRAKTGESGAVKANSTSTKIQYHPKEMSRDCLISTHSQLRIHGQVKTVAEAH